MSAKNLHPIRRARTAIRRVQWEDQEMPAAVLDGIERIFGARLAPVEAVAASCAMCGARGDAALREWAERIDRRPPGPLEVPAAGVARGVRASAGGTASGAGSAAERIAAFHRKQPMTPGWSRSPAASWATDPADRSASAYTSPAAPRRCPPPC